MTFSVFSRVPCLLFIVNVHLILKKIEQDLHCSVIIHLPNFYLHGLAFDWFAELSGLNTCINLFLLQFSTACERAGWSGRGTGHGEGATEDGV